MLFRFHLLATGLYLGTTAGLALFTVPQARRTADGTARRRLVPRVGEMWLLMLAPERVKQRLRLIGVYRRAGTELKPCLAGAAVRRSSVRGRERP